MQVVSLTTDFGTKDYYVAELKGTILSKAKDVYPIDISHVIDSYDIVQAAFFVEATYRKFPEGSIHIISVYNFYDEKVEQIAVKRDGHYFIGPNNGVISLLFDDIQEEEVRIINTKNRNLSEKYAHAVAMISHGMPVEELGEAPVEFTRKMGIQPVVTSSQIRATIIHIDHYENVVVNVKKDLFEKIRKDKNFSIYYKQTEPIDMISKNYGDVPVGETCALFNSAGYLEIAVNMGKASTMYNLNKDETIQINFQEQ